MIKINANIAALMQAHKDEFEIFCNELLEWSRIHSISAYRSKEAVLENILDSIYPLNFINDFKNALDVGSGGGFPAIALGIVKRDSSFVLTEPNAKKASFLNHIKITLNLSNIKILRDRVENIKQNSFDLITSRAFCSTERLIYLTQDLLKNNGYFLFYKGSSEAISNYTIRKDNRIYFYKQKGGKNG